MNKTNKITSPSGRKGGASLITITGPSGSGKDTVAHILSELTDIPVLVSFTTRPMRADEKQGREHYFVQSCNARKDDILAYTVYGGYEYWTTLSQIHGSAIYVIDEEGLRDLQKRFPDMEITSIYVVASKIVRRQRGVTIDRMQRDELRLPLPFEFYDYRIMNNFSIDTLRQGLKEIASSLT